MKAYFGILILLLSLALPYPALADGGMFLPDYATYVYAPSQKAAIIWDGSKETMILSTKISMDGPQNVAWVIPVPSSSKPDVSEGDVQIFYDIASLLTPRRSKGFGEFGAGQMGINDAEVEVLEEKKVDIYDIAILRATNASVLVDWLNNNGYQTPQGAIPVLQYYADMDNFYFIANKVNLENKYAGLKFTENDRACANEFYSSYYTMRRYGGYGAYVQQMINWTMSNLPQMSNQSKEAGCMNASVEAVTALYDLKAGIATPLKITFQPEKPFYPMRMTSLNSGPLEANVYVFSSSPVKDSSGLMHIERMAVTSQYIKGRLGLISENYLTYLKFSGDTSMLSTDSEFEPTFYDLSKDPSYVSPLEIMAVIFLGALFVIAYLWFITIVPLIAGVVAGWLVRNKSSRYKCAAFIALVIAEIAIVIIIYTVICMNSAYCNVRLGLQLCLQLCIIIVPLSALGFIPIAKKWKWWKSLITIVALLLAAFILLVLLFGSPYL